MISTILRPRRSSPLRTTFSFAVQEREFFVDNLLVRIHFIIGSNSSTLERERARAHPITERKSSSSLLLSGQELSDTKVHANHARPGAFTLTPLRTLDPTDGCGM